MCDTLVALPGATAHGRRLFAKNSDRERNEAQVVEIRPRARHAAAASVQLTYIAIAQAPRTHACLICRPFWMWGAEMGANEHGLVIGNEAVHAKVKAPRRRALTGMDLVRLALERAATAAEAVDLIIGLIERHGQGGDCGHLTRFYYHNSFLIADRREALVLETVGRWWAVQSVSATRAISNALTIGRDPDRVSPVLADHATRQGWGDDAGGFDFAGRLLDVERDAVSFGQGRCARAGDLLASRAGELTAGDMMAILRDHGAETLNDPGWSPGHTARRTICMHAAAGPRLSQTTGSMVSENREGGDLHWVTATAAPCLSLFKPVLLSTGLPDLGPAPTDRYDDEALWWRHERLHRAVLEDFAPRAAAIRPERDALEAGFARRMDAALAAGADSPGVAVAVSTCWAEARAAEDRWAREMQPPPPAGRWNGGDARSWRRLSRRAALRDATEP